MRLRDRISAVTGSGKDIGEGIARVISREGTRVVVVGRHAQT